MRALSILGTRKGTTAGLGWGKVAGQVQRNEVGRLAI
jgi:hypothetical protein